MLASGERVGNGSKGSWKWAALANRKRNGTETKQRIKSRLGEKTQPSRLPPSLLPLRRQEVNPLDKQSLHRLRAASYLVSLSFTGGTSGDWTGSHGGASRQEKPKELSVRRRESNSGSVLLSTNNSNSISQSCRQSESFSRVRGRNKGEREIKGLTKAEKGLIVVVSHRSCRRTEWQPSYYK